jgi:PmbA protein
LASCAATALDRAVRQIGPQSLSGGKMNVVVESECASKLLNPLLTALGGYSIQQKNSFLADKLGEKVFSDRLTVLDRPRVAGANGARLFDSEGVATAETPVIQDGTVRMFFYNTYIARKMDAAPTVEDCTRAVVLPTGGCKTLEDVLQKVGDGILVTGFNGGNSNSSTGDFSYGIEGYRFTDGRILHPVREMLMTGNFITLWNNLTDVADDARACMSKLIPTLAFAHVDVNG